MHRAGDAASETMRSYLRQFLEFILGLFELFAFDMRVWRV